MQCVIHSEGENRLENKTMPFIACATGILMSVPEDLSLEEREELLDIRRRKKELIDDIERLKYEIAEVMTEIDNLTSVEESKTTQRNKQVAMGRKKFNMDPRKGIQFLIENDLLQSSPEDVAQFLYKGEGLNKTVIGDYLGERDEFNIKVLQAFVELHEFADLNLVQALRQFLWSFRLPGEAQKIDRMMEAFAARYCLCNPGTCRAHFILHAGQGAAAASPLRGWARSEGPRRVEMPGGDKLAPPRPWARAHRPPPIPLTRQCVFAPPVQSPDNRTTALRQSTNRHRAGWCPGVSQGPGACYSPIPAAPAVSSDLRLRATELVMAQVAPAARSLSPWGCSALRAVSVPGVSSTRPASQRTRLLPTEADLGNTRVIWVPGRRAGVHVGPPAATGGPGRALWPGHGAEYETFSRRRKCKTQLSPSGISEKHSSSCRACSAQTHGVPLLLGGRVKTWKRRWFILTDNCLYYFEYTTDKEPRGIIPLENLSIREVEDPRKPNCFELYNPSHKGQVIKACKTEADGRVVEGNHVVYRISAPSPEEKEEWMKSIRASISRDPFYDMLATRKRRIANKK
ncbi:PREDICTED: cytohesin-3 [Bison bison bison]|uniref:Cytohesin-3 n=1 Tax=Bison bison bison TaxID=43346 RepID=A0A6P3HXQ6_BISBB|nr:PREDICTED: cytohesin-3 [Bison bison bison]